MSAGLVRIRFARLGREGPRSGALLASVLAVLISGCDKNPTKVQPPAAAGQRAWIGTYTAAGGDGNLVLDVSVTGTVVRGEATFTSPAPEHAFVSGSLLGDSLHLEVDSGGGPGVATFSLRAKVLTDSSLVGTLSATPSPAAAPIACRPLPRLRVTADEAHALPLAVLALAFDGDKLWLSTSGSDYVRLATDGTVADTITVLYRDAHWTSSVLAFDGTHLWGALPGSVALVGGGIEDYSEILDFDANGRAPDSLRLWQRSAGLAWDGATFRTLHGNWIVRFDGTGTVLDSLALGVPDAIHLDYDGSHFWTVGWFLRRLYQADATGRVIAICDLPGEERPRFAGGVAVEGAHLWYADSGIGFSTLHRLTVQ